MKTNTITHKQTPSTKKPVHHKIDEAGEPVADQALLYSFEDMKTALLVISLLINIFVLCVWVSLQVTGHYDRALIDFFIHR